MYRKTFLIMLKGRLKKDHPEITVEIYISRRSKFVHMGLDLSINKIPNHEQFINLIEKYWEQKKPIINLNL